MKVRELMTKPPVCVAPDLPLREVAQVLVQQRISGVPVVSDGRIVGVVSQSDIVRKECGASSEPERRRHGRQPAVVEATTAGEAMTSPAITIEDWVSAHYAAWLMSTHRINRLPVIHRDRLVGVISCADLVRHFTRSDAEIEGEVRKAVDDLLAPSLLDVEVDHGRVTLDGELDDELGLAAVPRTAARVPGVVAVDSHLHVRDGRAAV